MAKGRNRQRQNLPQLAKGGKPQQSQRVELRAEAFSGPLPHPDLLARYNDAVPNGAERIMVMTEKQSEHRRGMEDRVIDAGIRRANWGLAAAFVVAMSGLGVAALLILAEQYIAAAAVVGADLAAIVGTFIYGTRSTRGERRERYKQVVGE